MNDVSADRIARALESIAESLLKLANPVVSIGVSPHGLAQLERAKKMYDAFLEVPRELIIGKPKSDPPSPY